MNILVLGGGNSTERDVSLRSAQVITEALRTAGYTVTEADPAEASALSATYTDTIVFPILHGAGGEDGVIQRQLEDKSLPYLGTDSKASEVCFNKAAARQALHQAGLPVAKGETVTKDTYAQSALAARPHALKVTTGGSSIGTYIVKDPHAIDKAQVEAVFALGNEAVLEELVEGVEITVPVLDKQALSVVEISLPEGAEFNYENKYNGTTIDLCPAQSISGALQQKAQALAEQAHQALGCRHISRTDMIVQQNGDIIILEVNTLPGMTKQSSFPVAASVAGMDMPALVTKFVDMVKRDYKIGV